MALTTVAELIASVKTSLAETSVDGTRWKNSELLGYLNESYKAIMSLKPDANTINESFTAIDGTKQSLPDTGIRLVDVVRNLSPVERSISVVARKQLDMASPNWHSSRVTATTGIEQYIYDELNPKNFYLYPGAIVGTEVEIIYSKIPDAHAISVQVIPAGVISIDDSHVPAIISYVLYKAFDKDSGDTINAARAEAYFARFGTLLTGNAKTEMATSPNTGAVK
jgi:hypothetical protein